MPVICGSERSGAYSDIFLSRIFSNQLNKGVNLMKATAVKGAARTQGNAHAEPVKLLKRIGSTTYEVTAHFSKASNETMEDKILRMIEREVMADAG
jgi:hypothetical protein